MNLKSTAGDLNRLRKILTVIFEAGGKIVVEKLRLKYLVPWSCRIRCLFHRLEPEKCLVRMKEGKPVVSSEILREVLEKLGPTFIKMGQVLSLRADLVGEEISNELAKLQSDVAPFPYVEARQIITEELKQPPDAVFQSIEKNPVASASLAQVHRAYLKDGTEVAVKVQRPHIKETIEKDIHILFYLAHLAERFLPKLRPYQPVRVVKEFADWTLRELDFKVEGNNAERFRFAFKENAHIKIPLIYWDYTSTRVLTMEFVHGVKANDLEGIEHLSVNPRQLALYGVGAVFQQFLIDGFFHADPHPGNFFAMKGDVLCLHDFGMVGYLTQQQRTELVSCFIAFVDKNIDGFFKHFMHLATLSDTSDVAAFQKDTSVILSEFFFSTSQPSISRVFYRIINKGARYGISFPADLTLFGKAIVTTEAMGLKLYPDFNFNEELQPFVDKSLKIYLSPRRMFETFKTDIFDYLEFFKALPEKLAKIESGGVRIKFDSSEFLEFKREFDRQNDLRVLGAATIAFFFASSIFLYLDGIKSIGGLPVSTITTILFSVLLIWFIAKVRKKP